MNVVADRPRAVNRPPPTPPPEDGSGERELGMKGPSRGRGFQAEGTACAKVLK